MSGAASFGYNDIITPITMENTITPIMFIPDLN